MNGRPQFMQTRIYRVGAKSPEPGPASELEELMADASTDELRQELQLIWDAHAQYLDSHYFILADMIKDLMARLDELTDQELREASLAWHAWLTDWVARCRELTSVEQYRRLPLVRIMDTFPE